MSGAGSVATREDRKQQLVTWLEEEGFPGSAERLHHAEGVGASTVALEAATRIDRDGYRDSQAWGTAEALREWAAE